MGLQSFSFRRSPWSYNCVQRTVTPLVRGRRFQVRKLDLSRKRYLDVGCGPNTHENFVNLEYVWAPGIDLCWNILTGIPLPDGSMKGVFTEHCMEHFSPPDAMFVFRECFRLLEPRGTIRVIVPDAGWYLSVYERRRAGDPSAKFPFEDGPVDALSSPLIYVNRIFYTDRDSVAGHRCMYDEALLSEMLSSSGFVDVRREQFLQGRDPNLLVDSPHRTRESLYVEASKPE